MDKITIRKNKNEYFKFLIIGIFFTIFIIFFDINLNIYVIEWNNIIFWLLAIVGILVGFGIIGWSIFIYLIFPQILFEYDGEYIKIFQKYKLVKLSIQTVKKIKILKVERVINIITTENAFRVKVDSDNDLNLLIQDENLKTLIQYDTIF